MARDKFAFFILYYVIFCVSIISIGIYFASILKVDMFEPEPPILDGDFLLLVLSHNLKNFFMYIFGFLISPVLQLSDFGNSAFQIAMSYKIVGAQETINRLIPHGLLEFPNMLLYQGMSQYLLYTLIITRSFKAVLILFKKMLPLYIVSMIILGVAALLEGYF